MMGWLSFFGPWAMSHGNAGKREGEKSLSGVTTCLVNECELSILQMCPLRRGVKRASGRWQMEDRMQRVRWKGLIGIARGPYLMKVGPGIAFT